MAEWRWAQSIYATVHTAHLVELHDPEARTLPSSVKSLCGLRPLIGWRVDDSARTRCRRCELRSKMGGIIQVSEELGLYEGGAERWVSVPSGSNG